MKKFIKIWAIVFLVVSHLHADPISFQIADNFDPSLCRDLFFKFHRKMSDPSCDQEKVDDLLTRIYEQEISLCDDVANQMVCLQIMDVDTLIGYVVFQIMSSLQVRVSLFALDTEKINIDVDNFDQDLFAELLYSIFFIKPQLAGMLIACPVTSIDLINILEQLGFEFNNDDSLEYNRDLFIAYTLPLHQKCKICELLYGADFWEHELDPAESGDWGSWEVTQPSEYEIFPYADDFD